MQIDSFTPYFYAMHKAQNTKTLIISLSLILLVASHVDLVWCIDTKLEVPLKSSGNLLFYADVCQFAGDEGKTTAEIIYACNLMQFSATADTLNPQAVFSIDLQIAKPGTTPTRILERKAIPIFDEAHRDEAGSFIDLKRFSLVADSISLQLAITDSISGKKGNIAVQFPVKKFSDELSMSDLFFSSYIAKAEHPGSFDKHGLTIFPNPSRTFLVTDGSQRAYVYYEVNNLHFDKERPSYYSVYYSVNDLSGKELKTDSKSNIAKASTNSSRVEVVPLADLPSGQYSLSIRVDDLFTGSWSSERRYFTVYSAQQSAQQALPMTGEDIKKYFDQIKYIATHEEKQIYNELPPEGVQQFLVSFWQRRDPDPSTSENEYMIEHFKRLAYAESTFRNGINSDMGRVYIQYGPPADITREAFGLGVTKPIEDWIYALDGRVEFVFVDRLSDGNYLLVHSTHVDEFHNPDWAEDIK